MHFTREPLIETVIASKDGYKILVRNSKNDGREEYQVDAVEIVSVGVALFFRSLEKPKSFLVPVTDYEILEVRESRTPLKLVPAERVIKIAGGKESGPREAPQKAKGQEEPVEVSAEPDGDHSQSSSMDRRKRRRRRRGGRNERDTDVMNEETGQPYDESQEMQEIASIAEEIQETVPTPSPSVLPSTKGMLLPPPSVLISETLSRYREGKAPKREATGQGQDVLFFADSAEESVDEKST